MIYGFMDESGAPGVATNENDFLVVSLILFDDSASVRAAAQKVKKLRRELGLKDAYEFHCSHNAKEVQKATLKMIAGLDFCYITVAIRKTRVKRRASYAEIAKMLVCEIKNMCGGGIQIEMDSNPVLYRALKVELKVSGVLYARVREVESRTSDLVQVADYVVNVSAKSVRGVRLVLRGRY